MFPVAFLVAVLPFMAVTSLHSARLVRVAHRQYLRLASLVFFMNVDTFGREFGFSPGWPKISMEAAAPAAFVWSNSFGATPVAFGNATFAAIEGLQIFAPAPPTERVLSSLRPSGHLAVFVERAVTRATWSFPPTSVFKGAKSRPLSKYRTRLA